MPAARVVVAERTLSVKTRHEIPHTEISVRKDPQKFDDAHSAIRWFNSNRPGRLNSRALPEPPDSDFEGPIEKWSSLCRCLHLGLAGVGPKERMAFERYFFGVRVVYKRLRDEMPVEAMVPMSFEEIADAHGWSVRRTREEVGQVMRLVEQKLFEWGFILPPRDYK